MVSFFDLGQAGVALRATVCGVHLFQPDDFNAQEFRRFCAGVANSSRTVVDPHLRRAGFDKGDLET